MNLIKEINEIHALLAKSSMSELEYDSISKKLLKIKKAYSVNKIEVQPEMVCNIVSKYFDLNKSFYVEKSRKRNLVIARQIAAKIIMDNSSMTLQGVANFFNKTHATIIYSKRNIENLFETDRNIHIDYTQILDIVNRT